MSPPAGESAPTISEIVRLAAADLRAAGIETAGLDARIIAEVATGLDRAGLIAEGRSLARPGALETMRHLVARRSAGEPVARLVGRKEFWGLDFALGPETLVPRPDSETLVEAVLARLRGMGAAGQPLRILDLGTGTGCLLVALLHELPSAYGVGVDVSESALRIAAGNAAANIVAGRCAFVRSDWSAAISGPFDTIVSNPPYIKGTAIRDLMPEVARYEPRRALDGGADGLDAYRAILADCSRIGTAGATVALELGAGQAAAVDAIAREAGLDVVGIAKDLSGMERVLIAAIPECRAPNAQKALGNPQRTG